MADKIFFVSDLHLGAEYPGATPERDIHFSNFLKQINNDVSHLIILGDLFEFWMEYRYYIPKHQFNVLAAIWQLVENGVEVHYLSGNHDFNLGRFFTKKLGIQIHRNPLKITLQGKSLYIMHGDGIAASDWKYRFMKRILIHPLANWCFKLIHPDFGMLLAKLVGKKSFQFQKSIPRNEYRDVGMRLLQSKTIDIVVHGHTHLFFIEEIKNGLYINTGSWINDLQYIEMIDGVCSLKTYDPNL